VLKNANFRLLQAKCGSAVRPTRWGLPAIRHAHARFAAFSAIRPLSANLQYRVDWILREPASYSPSSIKLNFV